MTSDKRKIELIKELLEDHRQQKISSFASMIALQLIVDPHKPDKESKAFKEFVKTSIELNKGGI